MNWPVPAGSKFNLAVADCLVGVLVLPAFAATVLRGGPPAAGGATARLCALARRGATWPIRSNNGPALRGVRRGGRRAVFRVAADARRHSYRSWCGLFFVGNRSHRLANGAVAIDRFLNICHPLVYVRLAEPHKMAFFISQYIHCYLRGVKLAFHDADTDAYIVARIVARMSACRSDCYRNKKHLKNVGPIRHCEPPHAACFTLPFTRCRYCRTPPAHRCPQRRRQRQRQRVTEGTAMAPWNGPN